MTLEWLAAICRCDDPDYDISSVELEEKRELHRQLSTMEDDGGPSEEEQC